MNKQQFIQLCDAKLKLVRTEYSFSQEKMALTLGISKKTLIEIEKERSSLGWSGSVTLCCIFGASETLAAIFGGETGYIIQSLAFEGCDPQYPKASGTNVWWQTIQENQFYTIQQNIISQHYRLLDSEGNRIVSSFNLEDLIPLFSGESGDNNRGG